MAGKVQWDTSGDRTYETGADHGVLYQVDNAGAYTGAVAWNGLTTVTESPSGAESNPQYADNIKYVDLQSAEEFAFTIEAFTYPDEFEQNDGTAVVGGMALGQQNRKPFGFVYRTIIGNDTQGNTHGYKLHLIYGAKAAPSERAYATVNDSPEPIGFSWECSTTPVSVGNIAGTEYKPTALVTIDSTDTNVTPSKLAALETILFGKDAVTGGTPAPAVAGRLPLPAEIYSILNGS